MCVMVCFRYSSYNMVLNHLKIIWSNDTSLFYEKWQWDKDKLKYKWLFKTLKPRCLKLGVSIQILAVK